MQLRLEFVVGRISVDPSRREVAVLVLESVDQSEKVGRESLAFALHEEFEYVLVLAFLGDGLNVADLLRVQQQLAHQTLAAQHLDQQGVWCFRGEVPVQVLVVVDHALRSPRPHDAVGMGHEPTPKGLERHGEWCVHRVGGLPGAVIAETAYPDALTVVNTTAHVGVAWAVAAERCQTSPGEVSAPLVVADRGEVVVIHLHTKRVDPEASASAARMRDRRMRRRAIERRLENELLKRHRFEMS